MRCRQRKRDRGPGRPAVPARGGCRRPCLPVQTRSSSWARSSCSTSSTSGCRRLGRRRIEQHTAGRPSSWCVPCMHSTTCQLSAVADHQILFVCSSFSRRGRHGPAAGFRSGDDAHKEAAAEATKEASKVLLRKVVVVDSGGGGGGGGGGGVCVYHKEMILVSQS